MTTGELNELKGLIKNEKYIVHGDLNSADCVIGFSFGYRIKEGKVVPGKSNEQIATYIEKYLQAFPLILQFEIADVLKITSPAHVIRKSLKGNEYLNSYEVAEQAKIYMDLMGWKKAIIVTHPGLEARNDYICCGMDIDTITPKGLDTIEYDDLSEQLWTRNAVSWVEKELATIDDKYRRGLLRKPNYS